MTRTKEKEDQQQSSGVGLLLALVVGLAVLVGLYAYSRMIVAGPQEAPELPLASIIVEVNGFDAATRARICDLEKKLGETNLFGNPKFAGPAEVKVLVPGKNVGDAPTAKSFGDATDSEWQAAWKYLSETEYLVPRVFRLDGTACVIRLDPRGGHDFAPDAAAKLQEICDAFRPQFKGLKVYSRALGVGSTQDRDALNASFGVQLAWVKVTHPNTKDVPGPQWKFAKSVSELAAVKKALKAKPNLRRITTDADWVTYYWTTKLQAEKEVLVPTKDEEVAEAFDFAHANGIGVMQSPDSRFALIDTSTDQEGQNNVELVYYMIVTVNEMKLEGVAPLPKVYKPFKGETPADREQR